jgi:hypothetical protein
MSATAYNLSSSGLLVPVGGVFSVQITPVGGAPSQTDFVNLALSVSPVSGTSPVLPVYAVNLSGATTPPTAGTYLIAGVDTNGAPYYAKGVNGPFIFLNSGTLWQISSSPPGGGGTYNWIATSNGLTANYNPVFGASGSSSSVPLPSIGIFGTQPVDLNIPIPSGFVGTFSLTVGVNGSSGTLGLPLTPSSFSVAVQPAVTIPTFPYGSIAGMEAIYGISEVIFDSNAEAIGNTENILMISQQLAYAGAVINGYFNGVFQIPLIDNTNSTPLMVHEWANTMAYRRLIERKMPRARTKGEIYSDPLERVRCEMRDARSMRMDLNLVRSAGVNSPTMRAGGRGCFGGSQMPVPSLPWW